MRKVGGCIGCLPKLESDDVEVGSCGFVGQEICSWGSLEGVKMTTTFEQVITSNSNTNYMDIQYRR